MGVSNVTKLQASVPDWIEYNNFVCPPHFTCIHRCGQTYVAITQAIKEVQSGGAMGDRVDYNVSCIPIFSCHNVTDVVSFCSTLKNNIPGKSQSLL